MKYPIHHGPRLQMLRTNLGWSPNKVVQELYTQLGFIIPLKDYRDMENEQLTPTIDQFLAIADLYGVSLDYVVGRSVNKTRNTYDLANDTRMVEIAGKAKADALENCSKLADRMLKSLQQDASKIISKVADEDADLLGQLDVNLQKELNTIFLNAGNLAAKAAQDVFTQPATTVGGKLK